MGPRIARVRQRDRSSVDGDAALHRAAAAALRRGPVPDDVAVRDAALQLGVSRLEQLQRQWRWTLILFAVFIALYVGLAVTSSPWWWLGAALFAVFGWLAWWQPRRLERRVDALSGASGGRR